jgi:hypothetical protein
MTFGCMFHALESLTNIHMLCVNSNVIHNVQDLLLPRQTHQSHQLSIQTENLNKQNGIWEGKDLTILPSSCNTTWGKFCLTWWSIPVNWGPSVPDVPKVTICMVHLHHQPVKYQYQRQGTIFKDCCPVFYSFGLRSPSSQCNLPWLSACLLTWNSKQTTSSCRNQSHLIGIFACESNSWRIDLGGCPYRGPDLEVSKLDWCVSLKLACWRICGTLLLMGWSHLPTVTCCFLTCHQRIKPQVSLFLLPCFVGHRLFGILLIKGYLPAC